MKAEEHRRKIHPGFALPNFFLVACACVAALVLLPAAAKADTFGEHGIGAGQFLSPSGIAVDQSSGDIYVLGSGNHRVSQFDSSGSFVRAFGWGVADGANEPQSCGPEAAPPIATCQQGIPGPGPGQFSYPDGGIAVDPSGAVYVGEGGLNDRVQKFSSSGEFILTFGGEVDKTKVKLREEEEANSEPITVTPAEEDLCTAASGDICGAGTAGTANGRFDAAPHIAFGPAGTVYVADSDRVQRFEPDGTFAGQTATTFLHPIDRFAVDPAGNLYVREKVIKDGDGENNGEEVPPIHEYDPSGALLRTLDASGHPRAFVVDAAGDLFVRDQTYLEGSGGVFHTTFLEYDSSGAQVESFPPPGDSGTLFIQSAFMAYGQTAAQLYLTNARGFPDVAEVVSIPVPLPGPLLQPALSTHSSGVLAKTATLQASLNPEGKPSTYHFQYIAQAQFEADGEEFGAGTVATAESASIGEDFSEHQLSSPLSGLQPQTTYHYRIVAHNANGTLTGPELTFRTLPSATFSIQAPTALTNTGATLNGYLNPLATSATYRFEYVDDATFQADLPDGFAHATSTPAASAGEGSAFESESEPITGLSPATTYHFRLLAENAFGVQASPEFIFTTPPAACPNHDLREENNSTTLPDCRAYEMVSPPFKAYSEVRSNSNLAIAPSGERVIYPAAGTFAGNSSGALYNLYLAHRDAAGWDTESTSLPPAIGIPTFEQLSAATPDLTEILTSLAVPGAHSHAQAAKSPSAALYLRRIDGSFVPATPLLTTADDLPLAFPWGRRIGLQATPDLSKVVFALDFAEELHPGLFSSEPSALGHLYEVTGAGTSSSQLRVLNREDGIEGDEIVACSTEFPVTLHLGGDQTSREGHRHEISADGSRVFFEEKSPNLPGGCSVRHLLTRIDGQTTLDLADPADPAAKFQANDECTAACQNAPLASPSFQGASADGSKVFFTSTQQLTDDAGGPGTKLYEYDFNRSEGHRLVDLSAGESGGEAPQVHEVLAFAEDGSRIYFTAAGLLTSQPNSLGQTAQTGAENLYSIDTGTGRPNFIADLCSGAEQSGALHGLAQCPGSGDDSSLHLRGNGRESFDLTPDGRFLVFNTYAQLTPDDTNQAADVYRFDAQSASLLRVSIGHDGEDQNGNGGGQDALAEPARFAGFQDTSQSSGLTHAVSDDGSTIAFITARPLQQSDDNGQADVYEWHQGEVTLISTGKATEGVKTAKVDASGKDIFFTTAQGLLSPDRDGLDDLYDARVEGGFPPPQPEKVPCEGPESCGRTVLPSPPSPTIGTEENRHSAEPVEKPCKKGFVRKHNKCIKVRKHHKKRHHKRAANTKGRTGR